MNGKNLLHFLKYYTGLNSPVTQTSVNEQNLLSYYVQNARSIAEIGVFEGFNTREFALHSPKNAIIYAIDPFLKGFFGFSYGKFIAKKEWEKYKVSEKIKIIEGLSWDVEYLIPQLDFIFIDGDHSFEGVKKDFDVYSKKLSQRGIIAFHDARIFSNGWTSEDWGPVKLINEVIKKSPDWIIVEEIDSLVLVKRYIP